MTVPGATRTITGPQNGTQGVTTVRSTAPNGGVSTKIVTSTTGQATPTRATMSPNGNNSNDTPSINLPDITIGQAVGIGTLALLGLVGLMLLGMFFGYGLGWKDRDRKEKQFLASLSDSILYRKRH